MYSSRSSDIMCVAALGQPFTLGMLYDARKNELIPGLTLWDGTAIQKNSIESPQHSTEFHITASDSIESKSSLLDVEASLKTSFLGGLIEVGGSAKYLNDQKKFKSQSRVTLQYKATTVFRQLTVNSLGPLERHQREVIQKGLATHIVTGILYGAIAFFVFDSEKMEASSIQNTQRSMEAVIKKIPSFKVEGNVDIKLTSEEKALTSTFTCKFYGDLLLGCNPATFEEAVKTYMELPKLLGEKGEKGAPLKVWLMPLSNLEPTAIELKSELRVDLGRKAQDVLEDIRQVEMRCNDSLADSTVHYFPEICQALNSFQKLCNFYKSSLQQTLGKVLPSIREGREDQSSLQKLFEDRKKSPFSAEELSRWLDYKEREINIIRSCVDLVTGTNVKIIHKKSDLDRELLAPGVDDAFCYVFTSLETADPYLDAMANYLDSLDSRRTDKEPWFSSNAVIIKMRQKAKLFQTCARALKDSSSVKFLVAAVANEKYTGASIYHYREGILVTDDFSKPEVPPVRTITDRRCLIWYATELSLDPATANKQLILSEGNKKATFGEKQSYPDLPERFDALTQVLCREELTGRHYWEVEKGGSMISVAVTYKGIDRKDLLGSEFGVNKMSWCFDIFHEFRVMPNLKSGEILIPSTGINRVGVYLDWINGTLSLYAVSSNTLTHVFTFSTTFTKPLCPAIWVGEGSSAKLCPFH
ncbi:stonustoxin subunit beta-like [Aulostomus maculatus]